MIIKANIFENWLFRTPYPNEQWLMEYSDIHYTY